MEDARDCLGIYHFLLIDETRVEVSLLYVQWMESAENR